MILDMKTAMFIYVVFNILCALIMAVVWYQNRKRFAGLSFWLADLALQAGGALLIVLRGAVPDFVSMVVGNLMILGGIIVIYIGLQRFVGRTGTQIHNYVLLAIFIPIQTYFTLSQPSLEIRSILVTALTVIFTFQCCWLLLYRVSAEMRPTTRLVGGVFGGLALVSLIRTIRYIVAPLQTNDFFQSGNFETLMIIVASILAVGLISGLILMVNRRLVEEVQTSAQQLKWERDRAQSYFNMAGTMLLAVNSKGRVNAINKKGCEILEYAEKDVIGKDWFSTFTPSRLRAKARSIFRKIMKGEIEPFEYIEGFAVETRSGKEKLISWHNSVIQNERGEIIGILRSGEDITERHRMEEALKESEYRFRTFFEDAPMYCYMVSLDGKIIEINKSALETLGYNKEELVGQPLMTTIYAPDSREKAKKLFAEWKETGKTEGELNIITKDGRERTVLLNVHSVRDTDGKMLHSISVQRDITELRNMERDRKLLEQKAQVASRLASIGELASGVAHEINNPLTGVIGYSQLLLERPDVPQDIKDDLKVINEGAERVSDIVKRLLSFARQTKPARSHVDINSILASVLQLRGYHLKSNNISVTTAFDPDLPITLADAGQLQQVFLNLIVNAETEMKEAHNKGKLLIATSKSNGNILISFKDNGRGIPPANLQKIFDPFFTTREVGEGAGLGLSVCYGIMRAHNGRIWAESQQGKGATFIVELPVVPTGTKAAVLV